MQELSRHALGFTMLAGTLVLWVGSSVAIQSIFGMGSGFQKPVFVTLLNSAMSSVLLVPRFLAHCCDGHPCWGGVFTCSLRTRLLVSPGNDGELAHHGTPVRSTLAANCQRSPGVPSMLADALPSLLATARLASTVGVLWLCAQWVFNLSLLHTPVSTNTVLSSTSSVFTFLFSLLICGDPFRWRSFGGAAASFFGCALVAYETPGKVAAGAVENSAVGDALALASAAMFALASVLLRLLAPGDLDTTSYMGMTGLFAIGLSPVLLYVADSGGVESFRLPSGGTLMLLVTNAFLGCTFANYLYTSALLLLSPLVTNVCLSLSIPLSALFDEFLLKQHNLSAQWVLGAAVATSGVVLAALDLKEDAGTQPPFEEDTEELQPLVDPA